MYKYSTFLNRITKSKSAFRNSGLRYFVNTAYVKKKEEEIYSLS